MSRHENPVLNDLHAQDVPAGEVAEVTSTGITIAGSFNPGLAITLHPGARVYVLTEDDAIRLLKPCQFEHCDGECA